MNLVGVKLSEVEFGGIRLWCPYRATGLLICGGFWLTPRADHIAGSADAQILLVRLIHLNLCCCGLSSTTLPGEAGIVTLAPAQTHPVLLPLLAWQDALWCGHRKEIGFSARLGVIEHLIILFL